MRGSGRRPARFDKLIWLFPAAFALHVAEEAPGFTRWARRYASDRYTDRDFIRNNAAGLLMTVAGTLVVWRHATRPFVFGYFAVILTQQALFNAVFHAGTTVAYRAYSPGLFTSFANLLLWRRLSCLAQEEGLLTRNGELGAAAIGGLVHSAAVALQVFFMGLPRRGARRFGASEPTLSIA